MNTVFLIIHILACLGLILVVLLQTGKGASMGAAFGGSSQTVFGSSGATPFLAKLTTAVAVIFMVTSLGLAIIGRGGSSSSLMEHGAVPAKSAPAKAPAPAKQAPAQGSGK